MSRLIVSVPAAYFPERSWILSVLLGDFLGLDFAVETHGDPQTVVKMANNDSTALIIDDVLFSTPTDFWLERESLPESPLLRWHVGEDLPEAVVCDTELPVLYGRPLGRGTYFCQDEGRARIGLDIFGSSFFMLSRYEEVILKERDNHDRYPVSGCIAYKENFIERPLVNEYLEVLWAAFRRLWPSLQRKTRRFTILPTHDVDHPFAVYGLSATRVARSALGDVLKRRSAGLAIERMQSWFKINKYGADYDPNNTFEYLMDKSEERGLKSAFYFMTDHGCRVHDTNYDFTSPGIRVFGKIEVRRMAVKNA